MISSWYKASLFFKIYFPFLFILSLIFVFFFLYFEVIAVRNNLLCSSFVSRYMLEVIYPRRSFLSLSCELICFNLFYEWINLFSWRVVWKSLLAFLILMSSTAATIESFSNGECNVFSPQLSTFPFCLHPVSHMIAFHPTLFINNLIFSTNSNLQFRSDAIGMDNYTYYDYTTIAVKDQIQAELRITKPEILAYLKHELPNRNPFTVVAIRVPQSLLWRCQVVILTTVQLHSPASGLKFYTGLNVSRVGGFQLMFILQTNNTKLL